MKQLRYASFFLALVPAAQGVAQVRTASFDRSLGNAYARGVLHAQGTVRSASTYLVNSTTRVELKRVDATGDILGSVSLLGETWKAFEVNAFGYAEHYLANPLDLRSRRERGAANLTAQLGPWSFSYASGQTTIDRRLDCNFWLPPLNLFPRDPSLTFYVGPVPVTVSANAGVYYGVGMQAYVSPLEASAGAKGFMQAGAFGWARASVGFEYWGLGASAGVDAKLTLLDSKTSLDLVADRSGPRGVLDYDLRALRILVSLYARISYIFSSETWRLTLLDERAATITGRKELL